MNFKKKKGHLIVFNIKDASCEDALKYQERADCLKLPRCTLITKRMGNYICLCNLQLKRGQQVCLPYSTHRKTPTGNILCHEHQVAPLTFAHILEMSIFQPIISQKESQLLSLTFAKPQNNCNELSSAAEIYNNLT